MPNHVTHRMIFRNEAAKALFMEMKMTADPKESNGMMDFDHFCPGPGGTVDLHREKWGTKWNAYDQSGSTDDNGHPVLMFATAWGTCGPVWEAIAEKYPDVDLLIYYADEDTGNNLGIITISDGDVVVDERSGSSDEMKAELLNDLYPGSNWGQCAGKEKCLWDLNDDERCGDEECLKNKEEN